MEKIECGGECSLDIKRFYIPIVYKVKCPHCQEEIVRDFENEYLFYPKVNKIETEVLYCSSCKKESSMDIVLRIAIEIGNIRKNEE